MPPPPSPSLPTTLLSIHVLLHTTSTIIVYVISYFYGFNNMNTFTYDLPSNISEWAIVVVIAWLMEPGTDPGFQVRGGTLKKIASSGGRREKCWGISCEKKKILRQKIIFFPIAEGGANNFGIFRVKNHDFTPKNHIFSNFSGGAPPLDPPLGTTYAISAYHH